MDRPLPFYPERTISVLVQSPLEEFLVGRALDMAKAVRRATFQAPDGQVLDACENTSFDEARKLIGDAIQVAAQEFIADSEKKGLPSAPVRVVRSGKTRAQTNDRS